MNDVKRPSCRGDCEDGPRPCPWVSCQYHLYLDVTPTGRLCVRKTPLEEMTETCALDIANRKIPLTLKEIGTILNLSRERVRQIEEKALEAFTLTVEQYKLGL